MHFEHLKYFAQCVYYKCNDFDLEVLMTKHMIENDFHLSADYQTQIMIENDFHLKC